MAKGHKVRQTHGSLYWKMGRCHVSVVNMMHMLTQSLSPTICHPSHPHTHTHTHTHTPALFEKAEVLEEDRKPKHLILAVSSDRGLCGSVHSNVARYIRSLMAERGQDASTTVFVCIGDKVRTILQRQFRNNILMHFTEIGRKPPLFTEACFVAEQILNCGFEYESAEIVFNRFKWVKLAHRGVCLDMGGDSIMGSRE